MKNYTQAERKHVMDLYLSNHSISSISRLTGIARSTIYEWLDNEKPEKIKTNKEIYDLNRKVNRMQDIINILQEVPCSTKASTRDKCLAIQSLSHKYKETQMCAALKLSQATYFNFKKSNKIGRTVYDEKKNTLTPLIEEIFRNSNGIFGAPKICAILRSRGYTVSPKYVSDIMHENEWFSCRGNARQQYYNQKRKNILKRQFTVSKPNEVWVGDVTYFTVDGRTLFLCAILDLYSRKIIAYRTSSKNSTQLTKRTFKEAFEYRNNPKELMFHSDQGSNYTSMTYQKYLKECGVTQSFSKPGTPYDNSVIESFFKNLKNERLYIMNPQTEKEYRREIDWYMDFYNTRRPHETLQYGTPNAVEARYFNTFNDPKTGDESDT